MFNYKGATINFLKMIKESKIDEWFNKKDYPILLRKLSNGKEDIVKLSDDFVAKFDKSILGQPVNTKENKKVKDNSHLTKSVDDLY